MELVAVRCCSIYCVVVVVVCTVLYIVTSGAEHCSDNVGPYYYLVAGDMRDLNVCRASMWIISNNKTGT